jgi:hypothetical protein
MEIQNGGTLNMTDNGGRRNGSDRRYFTYTVHVPERRKGKERRRNKERRQGMRSVFDRYIPVQMMMQTS